LSTIGFFGIQKEGPGGQHDRPYLPKLGEMVGAHAVKVALTEDGVEYFNVFASKVKAAKLDSAIVTDQKLLTLILKSLPDYKQAYNKNGSEKKLSLNDYHGSLVEIEGFRLGREEPIEVLFLNPLEHLRTVPEAPYIFKRFISKLTKPESWFPQTQFTWEVANEDTVADLFSLFQSALLVACDIETDEGSPLRTINCSGYAALFADGTSHSVVIPTTTFWGVEWMRRFNSLVAPKVFQNGLYDIAFLWRAYGIGVMNAREDTMLLSHALQPESLKGLAYLGSIYTDHGPWKSERKVETIGRDK